MCTVGVHTHTHKLRIGKSRQNGLLALKGYSTMFIFVSDQWCMEPHSVVGYKAVSQSTPPPISVSYTHKRWHTHTKKESTPPTHHPHACAWTHTWAKCCLAPSHKAYSLYLTLFFFFFFFLGLCWDSLQLQRITSWQKRPQFPTSTH